MKTFKLSKQSNYLCILGGVCVHLRVCIHVCVHPHVHARTALSLESINAHQGPIK